VHVRALTWNLFHGRDAPPEPDLFTWRARFLRRAERGEAYLQVNRDLYPEFSRLLSEADWDVALLQECPPRWADRLAADCQAEAHRVLTSRNSFSRVRQAAARLNPDLLASGEGGTNTTLIRRRSGRIVERRRLELTRRPERRVMVFTRASSGLCVANLHTTNDRPPRASEEVRAAAEAAVEWAGDDPLVFGGDLNLRPRNSSVFGELRSRYGFTEPAQPVAIDHLLARGLGVVEPERAWPAEARELSESGLMLRLSDHAPVEALFESSGDG
jgi:endonuclease/exonuclease/phosphatase family metal-dependent hydrolase